QIVRNLQSPIWPFFNNYFTQSSKKIISSGKLKSNTNGEFKFQFLATPAKNQYNNPQYLFKINIWATSPSGEMQYSTQTIKLSKQNLFLSTNISSSASLKEIRNLIIKAKNIKEEDINTKAEFRLIKLKAPQKIIKIKNEEAI